MKRKRLRYAKKLEMDEMSIKIIWQSGCPNPDDLSVRGDRGRLCSNVGVTSWISIADNAIGSRFLMATAL